MDMRESGSLRAGVHAPGGRDVNPAYLEMVHSGHGGEETGAETQPESSEDAGGGGHSGGSRRLSTRSAGESGGRGGAGRWWCRFWS